MTALQTQTRASKMAGSQGAAKVGRQRAEPSTKTFAGKVAAHIGSLLEAKGVTVAQVADSCDVTEQAVWHWLSGRREIPLGKLAAIAKALGVKDVRQLIPKSE